MKLQSPSLLALVLLNVAILGSLAAKSTPQVQPIVRAELIELVDGKGQIRAQIKVEENGETVLRLRDAQGTIRVKLGASEEGAGLLLLDATTNPGLHVLAKGEETSLTLKGKRGKLQLPTN